MEYFSLNHIFRAFRGLKNKLYELFFRRDAGVVDRGGLENRCPSVGGPWVRIPLSPPFINAYLIFLLKFLTILILNFIFAIYKSNI